MDAASRPGKALDERAGTEWLLGKGFGRVSATARWGFGCPSDPHTDGMSYIYMRGTNLWGLEGSFRSGGRERHLPAICNPILQNCHDAEVSDTAIGTERNGGSKRGKRKNDMNGNACIQVNSGRGSQQQAQGFDGHVNSSGGDLFQRQIKIGNCTLISCGGGHGDEGEEIRGTGRNLLGGHAWGEHAQSSFDMPSGEHARDRPGAQVDDGRLMSNGCNGAHCDNLDGARYVTIHDANMAYSHDRKQGRGSGPIAKRRRILLQTTHPPLRPIAEYEFAGWPKHRAKFRAGSKGIDFRSSFVPV